MILPLVFCLGSFVFSAGCTDRLASVQPGIPATSAAVITPSTPREETMLPIILKDALSNIDAFEKTLDWAPFHPGVQISRIYSSDGPTAAFLKYQPGASVPLHLHESYEHIFILKGSQRDRHGEYAAGTVVVNSPGSSHTVSSPNGCIVLIIWTKPVVLAET